MNKILAATMWLLLCTAAYADPQSTAFTYQGNLKANGGPLNDTVDITFTLFDAATVGNPVGSPLVFPQTQITNGAVNEDLDFGDVFTGEQVWLEVKVGSETLAPRQKINSVPATRYAPQVFIGGTTNLFTPSGAGSLIPISGMYTGDSVPSYVTLNPDQSITVNAATSPVSVQVMPTSGRLTRIFGSYFGRSAPAGTLTARLYLGTAGTNTLTPTSLVCNFTLSSTTAACNGTSNVSYTAGQIATVVVTGSITYSVESLSISMSP
jgi:hypothetical protein